MPAKLSWKNVRRDYDGRALRTIEILAKYGITAYALNKRIADEGWTRRPSAVASRASTPVAEAATKTPRRKAKAKAAKTVPVAVPTKRLKPIAQRRKILERLYNTIERKLAIVEERTERKRQSVSAADFERDTRSIAQLIKSLEQATEFHHDQRGRRISGAAAKSHSIAAGHLADEADRLRRELAERLQRLVDPAGE